MRLRVWDFVSLLAFNAGGGDGGGGGAGDGNGGGGDKGGAGDKGAGGDKGGGDKGAGGGALDAARNLGGGDGKGGDGKGGDGAGDKGAQVTAYHPEGLGADFKGANDRETIDKLHTFVKAQGGRPEKATDYKLELDDALSKRFPTLKDGSDPALAIMQQISHKAGISNATFNTMFKDLYGQMTEKGLLDEPIDGMAELDKLEAKTTDPQRRRADAAARVNGVVTFFDGLVNRGTLSKDEANMLIGLGARASGVVALEKLIKLTGEHGIQPGGETTRGGKTIDDLKRLQADERYDSLSPKYDEAFRKQVDSDPAWRNGAG